MSRALPPRKAEALHQALAQLLHGVQETAAEVLTHLYDTGGLAELEMELEAGPPSPQPKSKSNKFHDKAVQGWGSATCGTLWADLSNNTAANIDDDLSVIDAGRSSNTWLAFEAKMNQPLAKALAAHSHNKQRYSFPGRPALSRGGGPSHTLGGMRCAQMSVCTKAALPLDITIAVTKPSLTAARSAEQSCPSGLTISLRKLARTTTYTPASGKPLRRSPSWVITKASPWTFANQESHQWVEGLKQASNNFFGLYPCDDLWDDLQNDTARIKHTNSMRIPNFTEFHTARQHYISEVLAAPRSQPRSVQPPTHTRRRDDPAPGARGQADQILRPRDARPQFQSSSLQAQAAQDQPMISPDVGQGTPSPL